MIKLKNTTITSLLIGFLTIFPLMASAQQAVVSHSNIEKLTQIQNSILDTNIILIVGFSIITLLLSILIKIIISKA